MAPVRLIFAEGPQHWQPRLRRQAPLGVLLTIVPYLAALTQMPEPGRAFSFAQAPVAALVSVVTLVAIAAIMGTGAWFLWQRKAMGVVLFAAGLTYVAPMITALAVAIVPMASGGMVLATMALILWSLSRLIRADRRISDAQITSLAQERILASPGGLVLAPSSAFPDGGLLTELQARQGGGILLALELAAACLVVLAGPLLMPLAVTGQAGIAGPGGALVWFLYTAIFLGARKPVNGQILLWRAIQSRA